MHILILGASSFVGTALAQAFALNNTLTLVGRNVDRLITATNKCKNSGAAQVGYVEQDFCLGVNAILQAIDGKHIDLIIDAASASSSKRDSEIESSEIANLVSADFSSRTKIIDHILRNQNAAPAVILISTVLTLVKSPGRTVYTALKGIYETYLNKLKDKRSDFDLLVVYVGTVIDTKNESNKPRKLASAVVKAFDNKKEKLFYGLSGVLFLVLFYFQPVLFYGVTVAQRQIRKLLD
jgi:short-subunit dehydrogenase